MEKRIKLNSGNTIPVIGFGTWPITDESAPDLVYNALKAGYRLIDSAEYYGNEKGIAKGIHKWLEEDKIYHKRSDVFFTTKIDDKDHGYLKSKAVIKKSLRNVECIGYIDLILIHSPQSDYKRRHGTWIALQEAVEEGSVKSIGVSNYGIDHLKELLSYPDLRIIPSVNQLEIHPWLTRKELVQFCRKFNLTVEAYSPLTQGNKLNDVNLKLLAKKYHKCTAQILLRWSLEQGFIPIPKTTHVSRMRLNYDVFDFSLTQKELVSMDHGEENICFCWDPTIYPIDNKISN